MNLSIANINRIGISFFEPTANCKLKNAPAIARADAGANKSTIKLSTQRNAIALINETYC